MSRQGGEGHVRACTYVIVCVRCVDRRLCRRACMSRCVCMCTKMGVGAWVCMEHGRKRRYRRWCVGGRGRGWRQG